jgi:cytochrome c-type biogenesis protein CcmH/NrfF
VDLQSRLKAKQAAEAKLLEIMEQATRAEDVLAIYLQVQTVQTEIEQLKGQIQYLEESSAMSSISVRLIAEAGTQPIEIGPWKPEGAAKEAIQDLIFFVQNFADFLIRFVLLTLPALILIAIPLLLVYLVGRAIYRRTRRSRVEVEEVRSEEVKK